MPHTTIVPSGPFSLRESALFGFGQRCDASFDGTMRLAFCLDGSFHPVGAALSQTDDGTVHLEVVGGDAAAVQAQVARVLSLDADGAAFAALGDVDPVLARLLATAPGLRPPLFHSAYEAAAWAVLSARRPATQMREVRRRLSAASGSVIELGGEDVPVFPSPTQLLGVDAFPGLTDEKIVRLHGIAQAALDGELDTAALRALDPAEAEQRLLRLRGIGPFSAALVVVRALGHTDVLPVAEPTLLGLVGDLWGLGCPATLAQLAEVAEPWRPYRTWASVLVRAAAARVTSVPA